MHSFIPGLHRMSRLERDLWGWTEMTISVLSGARAPHSFLLRLSFSPGPAGGPEYRSGTQFDRFAVQRQLAGARDGRATDVALLPDRAAVSGLADLVAHAHRSGLRAHVAERPLAEFHSPLEDVTALVNDPDVDLTAEIPHAEGVTYHGTCYTHDTVPTTWGSS